jgi:hypothetical protein
MKSKYAKIVKYENGFYWLIDLKTGEAIDGDKRKYVVKDMAKRWGYTIQKDMPHKLSDKRILLIRLIEIELQLGYDISDLVGYPLSSFNWDGIADTLEKRYKEYKKNNGVEYGS